MNEDLEKTLVSLSKVLLALDITYSMIEYMEKNHPEIYNKALSNALDTHTDRFDAIRKYHEEKKKE